MLIAFHVCTCCVEGEAGSGNWEVQRMRSGGGGMSLPGRLGLGCSWGLPGEAQVSLEVAVGILLGSWCHAC